MGNVHSFINILDSQLADILQQIVDSGGRPFVVGGAVRDFFFGEEPKDFDVEVFGISAQKLVDVLSGFGSPNIVGRQFGVVTLVIDEKSFDFSLPRRDNKNGVGTQGFDVQIDSNMTIEEAAFRRDFTINAISFDFVAGKFVDPFNGVSDVKNRFLRPVSSHFGEDPLRILRGFQFVSRFDLSWDDSLRQVGRELLPEFPFLSQERVRNEWVKWAEKSVVPSHGLQFLRDVGWLHLFPSLSNMVGVLQDSEWHPEGDVFEHTCEVVDAMAWQCNRDGILGKQRTVLMFAALCHDMGKVTTTVQVNKGGKIRWVSPGHDIAGVNPTRSFMQKLFVSDKQKRPSALIDEVVALVKCHMRPQSLASNGVITRRAVRRLACDVSIQNLSQLVNADSNGRPFSPDAWTPSLLMDEILNLAKEERVDEDAPTPILRGKDLIGMGMSPGPRFGVLLREAFDAQVNGEFVDKDSALSWVLRKQK